MFWASLCPSSGEQRLCVTACGVLRWFCWMWLVAAVGRCVVGTQRPTAATNHIQQNKCSTPHTAHTVFVLLKMGIMMPETCWDSVDNKHLFVASCWFSLSLSLSLHNLLTMHGHRNIKFGRCIVGDCRIEEPWEQYDMYCTVLHSY